MGFWIVLAVVLFVLGSIMGLKPSGLDQRLDKLRMTARRLHLNPKLIACPAWVKACNPKLAYHSQQSRDMIAQYALIIPDKQLPELYYQIIDGQLRPFDIAKYTPTEATSAMCLSGSNTNTAYVKTAHRLDKTPLGLPQSIAPWVQAVYVKANCLVVFWDDKAYVQSASFDLTHIEPELEQLKQCLQVWADILQD